MSVDFTRGNQGFIYHKGDAGIGAWCIGVAGVFDVREAITDLWSKASPHVSISVIVM